MTRATQTAATRPDTLATRSEISQPAIDERSCGADDEEGGEGDNDRVPGALERTADVPAIFGDREDVEHRRRGGGRCRGDGKREQQCPQPIGDAQR